MNTVLVPLPDGRTLALELDNFNEAIARGEQMAPSGQSTGTELGIEVLDAAGMEQRTNVPASWWLEAARRGDVPSIKAGKYVRFDLAASLAVLERR